MRESFTGCWWSSDIFTIALWHIYIYYFKQLRPGSAKAKEILNWISKLEFFSHKKKTKTVHPTEPGYSWSQQGAPGMDFFHRACFKWKSLTGPVLPLWVSGWLRVLPCLGWNAWLESPEPFGNRHHARDDPRPLRNHLASGQQKQHLWHKSSQHLQAAPCTRRKPTKNRTIRDCDWNVWLFTAKC